ncbi:MAG: alkaline phosphatase family protein, partial [Candidatus Cybelea sp.]
MKLTACLLGLAFVAVVVACTNSQTAPPLSQGYVSSPQAMQAAYKKRRHHDSSGPITKIFVIVQENRTVDNLFQNFPGAHTQPYGYNGSKKITLTPVDLATPLDLGHSLGDYNRDTGCPGAPILSGGTIIFSCPMNGFQAPSGSYGINAYQYVKATDTKPYFDMGEQYVFGDTMFQSNLDGSYVSHQYLVAGQANSATDFPVPAPCNGSMATPKAQWVTAEREYGKDPKYITACQTYKTVITQELENASLKWRYYVGASGSGLAFWDPFFWIISGYGYYNNHKNIVSPPCQFLSDIGTSSYAPDVTWITPSNQDSDHAGNGFTVNRYGPDWLMAVVNA